jgi:hypothetical protein
MTRTKPGRRGITQFELLVILVGVMLLLGLLVTAVQRVREAAARTQSMNNCKQMCLAVNNVAATSVKGYIPPSYGPFPATAEKKMSFFVHLLPYLEGGDNLFDKLDDNLKSPFKTYIAPADPFNPGTDARISYASNANVLTVNGGATFPASFGGRTSGIMIVFERTAKSEATWNNDKSYLEETAKPTVDGPGNTAPEFGPPAEWKESAKRATALTRAGCIVGMGDGSARIVNQSNAKAGWAWAMNPLNPNPAPVGW